MQNFRKACAAPQPCRRQEVAGWRASYNTEKRF